MHSSTTRAVLRSLVPVICPAEAAPLADAIVDHMALTIGASGPLIQQAIAAGTLAYDLGSLPRYFRRAHALSPDRAERYYSSWEHGGLPFGPMQVQFARALNQLMSLSCYEQPAMMAAIGYVPEPWIAEVTKKRLHIFADDVRRQEAQILAPDPLRPNAIRRRA